MTEVRRVAWPAYEDPQWSDPLRFQQGIAGALELFFWAWVPFQDFVGETTGHPVPVFQRVDQAGFTLPLDERVLADTDTLFVFGLDHMVTGQDARRRRSRRVRAWLRREGTCLVLGPHHDVGAADDLDRAGHGVPPPRRRARAAPAALRPVHALADGRASACRSRTATACARRGPRAPSKHRAAVDRPGPGHQGLARRRDELQLPHAPAALRA